MNYKNLSKEVEERIRSDRAMHIGNPFACKNEDVIRRNPNRDKSSVIRPAFVRDVEKIMHTPYYSRYMDKTQVFSLYRNDDVSRRALHVQFVARIARNIGSALNLNTDLIEAIALGHDIGHTPFGHPGESALSRLYFEHTGKYFNHNIHSARVLDSICPLNLSLQTLDGIICHNGELEAQEYRPVTYTDFTVFDEKMNACYRDKEAVKKLVPSTLEGCVVRVSDIIAYLGKDRQDAIRLGLIGNEDIFNSSAIGNRNAEIINNLIVSIVENSYGKPYLSMDEECFKAFSNAKRENYASIYQIKDVSKLYEEQIKPMFEELYLALLKDAVSHNENSYLYTHHIKNVEFNTRFYQREIPYRDSEPDDLVTDYIASMTDDYFVDLYKEMFPKGKHKVEYIGYFK